MTAEPEAPPRNSTFEAECLQIIKHLETVDLRKAELRLAAAERAVERARTEIEAFRLSIQVHREMFPLKEDAADAAADE